MPQEIVIHDEEAQRFLTKAMAKVKEVGDGGRAFGMALSAVVFQDVDDHFQKEEGPDGRWAPWSKIYREHMERIGKGGNKILQDEGKLRGGFMPTNYRKVGEGILWFNPISYAHRHNEGTHGTPARTFMWLSDPASERIADVTLNFVLGRS